MPAVLSTQSNVYAGWVYVMRNERFPVELLKIGYTEEIDIDLRAKELTKDTGVPGAFNVKFAVWVNNVKKLEKHIHETFSECRLPEKYEGAPTKPEFFEIVEGSKDWKFLLSIIDREVHHGGIRWESSHGKYRSPDLFGPFNQTKHNKIIIREDAELVAEPAAQSVTGFTGDHLGELLDALEINNTSSESEDSHDGEEQRPIRRRSANVKYYLNRLSDGAIVATPERLTWSMDPRLNGKDYSMKARYNAQKGVLVDLERHMDFSTLSELCAEFVNRLGWSDAFGRVFKHSPGAEAVEHKKNNNTISWHTMHLLDGESKTLLKHVIS